MRPADSHPVLEVAQDKYDEDLVLRRGQNLKTQETEKLQDGKFQLDRREKKSLL